MQKLPYEILAYIRNHFQEGYLSDVKSLKDKNGQTSFKIEVTQNEVVHQLEFNGLGKLTKNHSKPRYEEDYYEGSFYGEKDR